MRYLLAILGLGLLIALHEWGHLLAAKALGIRVRWFSFGFGPPILKLRRKGTEWRLGALLLGGNVRLKGANPHEDGAFTAPDALLSRPWWQRALVLFAGSALNGVFALVLLVALFAFGTHVPVPMTLGIVAPGSPAARAQLLPGDEVVRVDGEPLEDWSAFVDRVARSPEEPLLLTLRRGGEEIRIRVVPERDVQGRGTLGVRQQYVFRRHGVGAAFGLAVGYIGTSIADGAKTLWALVAGQLRSTEVVSPVGIVKEASDVTRLGWDAFFRVLAQLSVALALFNLAPLPALDGGRIVLVVVEGARKKRLDPRVETVLHAVGFLALLGLIVWVAWVELRSLMNC